MPLKELRPAEGSTPKEKWHTAREGAEGAPVASFIDSLPANDAAIEVILGQGRLLTLKKDIAGKSDKADKNGLSVVAVGDPTVVDFNILPPRMIRLIGLRAGVTDLSVTTIEGQTYTFEIRVVYDLDLLRAQLRQSFPNCHLRLAQLREHLIVEGQARSTEQVSQIVKTLKVYLSSTQLPQQTECRWFVDEYRHAERSKPVSARRS
ncbi:MAG: pilus assembly protein N-terminal domain-containing protein [Thermoguttaceae bacterium]